MPSEVIQVNSYREGKSTFSVIHLHFLWIFNGIWRFFASFYCRFYAKNTSLPQFIASCLYFSFCFGPEFNVQLFSFISSFLLSFFTVVCLFYLTAFQLWMVLMEWTECPYRSLNCNYSGIDCQIYKLHFPFDIWSFQLEQIVTLFYLWSWQMPFKTTTWHTFFFLSQEMVFILVLNRKKILDVEIASVKWVSTNIPRTKTISSFFFPNDMLPNHRRLWANQQLKRFHSRESYAFINLFLS